MTRDNVAEVEPEILRVIEAYRKSGREPLSRLGYFCAPFRPTDGPLRDKVVKVYRAQSDTCVLNRLATAHANYLAVLEAFGLPVPSTELYLLRRRGKTLPVIVQAALPEETLLRPQLIRATPAVAIDLMETAGEMIARFWEQAARYPARIGFHPSIRNLAVRDGEAIFFDSFPPLIGYSRQEVGQLLITFSESRCLRGVGPIMRRRVESIQDEWYAPSGTLLGLVGSACRLRPDQSVAFLEWARDFSGRRMPQHTSEIASVLRAPPQLPRDWMAVRKMMRLEGAPNT
ncbi:DUF6206 family protein [Tropicimonas marinistellae]|uniref:DUF6206 family protein n=1 Tax=Tropicimonas marinistellae TaxID=1739787 RepID=UPI00083370E6|nr:DUF6206 family protein [Tropicimonas marinistellae]